MRCVCVQRFLLCALCAGFGAKGPESHTCTERRTCLIPRTQSAKIDPEMNMRQHPQNQAKRMRQQTPVVGGRGAHEPQSNVQAMEVAALAATELAPDVQEHDKGDEEQAEHEHRRRPTAHATARGSSVGRKFA